MSRSAVKLVFVMVSASSPWGPEDLALGGASRGDILVKRTHSCPGELVAFIIRGHRVSLQSKSLKAPKRGELAVDHGVGPGSP